MSENLKTHIQRYITLSDAEFSEMLPFFNKMELKKKENLLTEGSVCTSNYFVAKGCLRLFFINDKGIEQTIQFALENWWMSDYDAFENQKPAEFYLQAVEKSEVFALEYDSLQNMLQKFPAMERYFRLVQQRAYAATQFRIRDLYSLSREESYHRFADRHPEFVQRIPQYLLASFLGFTPEYLSEIRAKRRS
jgi:CRP-like cAMP-binding protein